MGNKHSTALQDTELRHISFATGFSMSQIEKLYSRFCQLDRSSCGHLSREDLLAVPELAMNPVCDRLVQLFFTDRPKNHINEHHHEHNATSIDEGVNFRRFALILAAFKPEAKKVQLASSAGASGVGYELKSSLDSKQDLNYTKLELMFKFYDADGDGKISFPDLKWLIKSMVGNHIEESQLDKIALRAFIEVDADRDAYISFEEFCRVIKTNELEDRLRVKFFT